MHGQGDMCVLIVPLKLLFRKIAHVVLQLLVGMSLILGHSCLRPEANARLCLSCMALQINVVITLIYNLYVFATVATSLFCHAL
jgi:hypothetical protein